MLNLVNIRKEYKMGDNKVHALRGVDCSFRDNEFVAILGHSGCGKTTLLNIIGGLDRYTDGDLLINGVTTKKYKDRDWDTYRNHSVGFVFQTYNLIPHQNVLSNVELALTLSGVKKSERRKRAKEALKKVGLGDQLKKKPNQMSGGQMQRVAIARALVNNPDILLADEPTGALDTETSIQIMEILKEVAKDRLVIMVTHNPELAEEYATRIVNLKDGKIVGDSNPVDEEEIKKANEIYSQQSNKKRVKKPTMSFFTALSLSFKNLLTKKARTFLTSFAGSIGIIGIALILSLSSGIQAFIDGIQEDTLSSYPIVIEEEALDMSTMMASMMSIQSSNAEHEDGYVYANTVMYDMLKTISGSATNKNNLKPFKAFLEENSDRVNPYINSIQYGYDLDLLIYDTATDDEAPQKLNPSALFEGMISDTYSQAISPEDYMLDVWQEMIPSKDGGSISPLITDQYEIVENGGRWPQNYNEVVLVVTENNEIADTALYALGFKDADEVDDILLALTKGEEYESSAASSWSYDEVLGKTFKLVLPTDLYSKNENGVWEDISTNDTLLKIAVDNAEELKIVGIIRPKEDATAASLTGTICYTKALTNYYIDAINDSEIVKEQLKDTSIDVLSGAEFIDSGKEYTDSEKAEMLISYISHLPKSKKAQMYKDIISTPPEEMLTQSVEQYMTQFPDRESRIEAMLSVENSQGVDEATIRAYFEDMSDEEIESFMINSMKQMITAQYAEKALSQVANFGDSDLALMLDAYYEGVDEAKKAQDFDEFVPESTLENTLHTLGSVEYDNPSKISIYPVSFDAKQAITDIVSEYNEGKADEDKITYTDYVALMMSSVSTIVDAVTYGLTAFVSISLVVSSIMIGVITYISVLERTKEIGVLRSMGASKRNVSNIFTAETLIIGFISGLLGVGLTLLLNIPVNIILDVLLTDVTIVSELPMGAAAILVGISMLLTFIAGLIPSRLAAKKDPVVALRSE